MRMDWEPLLRNLVTWRGRFWLQHDSRRDGGPRWIMEVTGILVEAMDEWRETPSRSYCVDHPTNRLTAPSANPAWSKIEGPPVMENVRTIDRSRVVDRRDLSTIGFSGAWRAAAVLLLLPRRCWLINFNLILVLPPVVLRYSPHFEFSRFLSLCTRNH